MKKYTSNKEEPSRKKLNGLGKLAQRALSERTNRPNTQIKKSFNATYQGKNQLNKQESYNYYYSNNIENSFTKWINFMLVSYDDSLLFDAPSGRITPKKVTEEKKKKLISYRAKHIYNEGSKNIFPNISNSIEQGHFKISNDKHLYADLGLRESFINLLFSYSTPYLKLALETIFSRKFEAKDGNTEQLIKHIILYKILRNKSVEKKYATHKFKEEKIKFETDQYIVKTFLELIWCLDKFRLDNLVEGVCLFNKTSLLKSSNQILCQFTKDYLSGEGDTILSLNYLGYKLNYTQTALDEFDFTVYDLSHDLRDGIRLAKLAENISKLNGLENSDIMKRINTSDTKFRRVQNVKLALETFHICGIPVSDIDAKEIVSGHRAQTLKLLWRISYASILPSVIQIEVLKDEIERIRFLNHVFNKPKVPKESSTSEPCSCLGFNKELFTGLLEWCQSIGEFYGFPIFNFTESFSDLKAICYIISFYLPETMNLYNLKKIHEDKSLSEKEKLKETYKLITQAIEQIGFIPLIIKQSDFMNNTIEEKLMIMFLSYLCNRLINIQNERRSAIIIQRAFRLLNRENMEQRKLRHVITLQKYFNGYIEKENMRKYKQSVLYIQSQVRNYLKQQNDRKIESVIKIQSYIRTILCKKEFLKKRNGVIKIQSLMKAYLERKHFKEMKSSAILIQSLIRRKFIENEFKKLRRASIIIQSYYRSFKQRQVYNEIKKSVLIIQAALRSYQQRIYYQKLKKSCIMIQSKWRSNSARINYLNRRNAIITIQKYYFAHKMNQNKLKSIITIQSMIRGLKARASYNRLKHSTMIIQKIGRKFLEQKKKNEGIVRIQSLYRTMKEMRELCKLKDSCLIIQSIYRCHREKVRFNQLKQSTLIIQKYARKYISHKMKQKAVKQILSVFNTLKETQKYNMMRKVVKTLRFNFNKKKQREENSIILIQSFYRMTKCRSEYKKDQNAIKKVQAIIRAKNCMTNQKQIREAVLKIQNIIRSYLQMLYFKRQKDATILIQSLYRMNGMKKQFDAKKKAVLQIQRQFRRKIEEKKRLNAILTIQSVYRASKEYERFINFKKSVIFLQKAIRYYSSLKEQRISLVVRLQSLIRMYIIRKKYQQKLKAVKVIQNAWRDYQLRLEKIRNESVIKLQSYFKMIKCRLSFQKYKLCTIKLQSIIRMKQARDNYLSLKQAVLSIQRRYKMNIKLKQSVITLQNTFRMFIERENYKKLKSSVTMIQRFYRQHIKNDNQHKSTILKHQDKSETLGALTHFALNDLLSSTNLTLIVNRCSTLELSTRYSEACALSCLDYKIIPILFNLMNDCNRSAPHIKLLKSLLSILINIASYKDKTCPNIYYQKEDSLNILSILLTKFKDVPEVFCPTLILIKALYPYKPSNCEGINIKKMNSLLSHLIKKEQMDIKSKRHEIILKKTRNSIKLLKDVINILNK